MQITEKEFMCQPTYKASQKVQCHMTAGNKNYYSTVDRLWFWIDKDLLRVSMDPMLIRKFATS